MSEPLKHRFSLPPEQQAIRDKCFHPSGTFVEFPKEDVETSIPARFEKIVRTYPDRLAVKMGERALTYDEFNLTANRIAHAILAACGKESQSVALLFEHGVDVIAGIFGSLKAGKFHVALDPSFPPERIIQILEDSQVVLIVTNNLNVDLARWLTNNSRPLLNIDEINDSLPFSNLDLSIIPTDLAKFRYTSGSTGKPKGVVKTHRDVLRRAMSVINDEMHTCAEDRLSLLHSTSFASADNHLFSSLLSGAALYPFDIKSLGITRLIKWLMEEQITVYHSPPLTFRQLAEQLSSGGKIGKIRLIHLSGAPISRRDFELYKAIFESGPLLEISMGSTEFRGICLAFLDRTFCFPKTGSPIGYPRLGTEILLLDESGKNVGPGEVGEIAVKGSNIEPGFWKPGVNRIGISHAANSKDEELYLTGDMGCMLLDGFLIHHGRKDLIVKIRGYRVNLGEVEGALLDHPLVKEAGVAGRERDPGEWYLIGYIVPRQDSALNVSDLNEFLRQKLPDYMVPSTFLFLESLPVTNGKLDRSALPKPENRRPNLRAPYVPPCTEIEKRLSLIWCEILSLDQVGACDNFFDLGGHSLLATQIVSRIRSNFSIDLPLRHLFESPTVAEMAVIIAANQANRTTDSDLEQMLREVEATTEEDAQKLLGIERGQ